MSNEQNNHDFLSLLDNVEQKISRHYHRFIKDVKASTLHLLHSGSRPLSDCWHQASDSVNNHRRIVIHNIHYAGEEWVEIKNQTLFPQLLSGWRINAGNKGQDFTFPDTFVILPGDVVKVYTNQKEGLSFNSEQPIWNNKGDTGYLFSGNGELVCSFKYGNHAHKDIELSTLQFDGEQTQTEGDEYVALRNRSDAIIDISQWRMNAGRNQEFTFPDDTTLFPNEKLRIYTNQEAKAEHETYQHFSMQHSTAIWRNKGDIGYLYDNKDHRVISWAYGEKLHEDITISALFNDGENGRSESDEYIELLNNSIHVADISGWTISAGNDVTFTFPQNSHIHPDTKIRVYTNEVHSIYGGYSFERKQAIWNNKEDIAEVFDYKGNAVCQKAYGNKAVG